MRNRFLLMLLAILLGNLAYFALLPYLPRWAQHRSFAIDLGLAVDFAFCLVVYGVLLAASGRRAG